MTDSPMYLDPKFREAAGQTLNEELSQRGFVIVSAGNGRKHIVAQGEVVFTGDAAEVWEWV